MQLAVQILPHHILPSYLTFLLRQLLIPRGEQLVSELRLSILE